MSTINSIKKCKGFYTLFLQETDKKVGVKANWCSTFLSSSGLLAEGEYANPNPKKRNAVVTFRDPSTAKIKGGTKVDYIQFLC